MTEPDRQIPDVPAGSEVKGAPAADPVIRMIAMPSDANPAGDIFGGWLMSHMDLAAGNIATRRARGRTATIAVEGMRFLRPVLVGDEVSFYGEIIHIGRTSMKIHIEAWRRKREEDDCTKVTEAVFTFVAIDHHRQPRPIPGDRPSLTLTPVPNRANSWRV